MTLLCSHSPEMSVISKGFLGDVGSFHNIVLTFRLMAVLDLPIYVVIQEYRKVMIYKSMSIIIL